MVIAAPVAAQLRDDILAGTFPPGERLIELQLTERYGVGRAAIRAALVELDSEGLVRREANRGATVRRISVTEAVEHDDKLAYSKLNRTLHGALCRIARHRVADDLVANLRNRAAHHQFRLALVPGRAAESLAQHGAIVEAVTSGDRHAAEEAMRAHLASVIDVLRHWEAFDTRA